MDRGNAWDLVQEDSEKARTSPKPQSFKGLPSTSNLSSHLQGDDTERELPLKLFRRSKSPTGESLLKRQKSFFDNGSYSEPDTEGIYVIYKALELPWIEPRSQFEKPVEYKYDRLPDVHTLPKKPNTPSTSTAYVVPPSPKEKCAYLFRGDSYVKSPAVEVTTTDGDRTGNYDPYCPIHGSRKRCRKPRLKDAESFHLTSIESVEMEPTSVILLSQGYAAKMIRKRKRATLAGIAKFRNRKEKHKIEVNLWIMSVAFLFLFTAFHGLQNLQTSINRQLGADSLCVYYFTVAISSLFVPPFMLNRLGCKLTLIVSSGIYMIYMIANFLPKYYSLIPAAMLAGCAGSCLFATKCVYISESGIRFAQLNVEDQNVVIVRFFGFFFTVLHFGQVVGNVLSSFILTLAIEYVKPADGAEKSCGYLFQEDSPFLSEQAKANLKEPPRGAFLALCGSYFCCSVVALMIVSMFLNSLRKDRIASEQAPRFSAVVLKTTVSNLRKPKPLLLTPLTIFNGLEQAFLIGYYTKAYVACGLGISQIGYVMTAFGIADAICSLFFGPLMKLFGRMPLFVFGAVVNMLTIMTLMQKETNKEVMRANSTGNMHRPRKKASWIWPLNPGDTELFYVIAGVWGMADGVWNTQLNGLWVVLSRSSLEAAFANYHFWESSGIALGLLLTRFTTISQVLIISFTVLLIGITGYFIVEFYEEFMEYISRLKSFIKRKQNSNDKDMTLHDSEQIHMHPTQLNTS